MQFSIQLEMSEFVCEAGVVLWWVLIAGLGDENADVVRRGELQEWRGGTAIGCEMEGDGKSACMQSPAMLCIFNMEKAAVLPWQHIQNQRSARTPQFHPTFSPSLLLLPPGHLPADLELRPQTGLLRGAGIRLGTGIMSKAPTRSQSRNVGQRIRVHSRPPPLLLLSTAAINFPNTQKVICICRVCWIVGHIPAIYEMLMWPLIFPSYTFIN